MYKIILHIIGLVLAFLTRNIEVEALSDSKYTAVMIYYSSFILILVIIVLESTKESNNLRKPLWAFVSTVAIYVFLGLTFIPKVSSVVQCAEFTCHFIDFQMYLLYKDPKGDRVINNLGNKTASQIL